VAPRAAFPTPLSRRFTPRRGSTPARRSSANCVTCHGDDARNKADLGAPDLTDRFWSLRRRRGRSTRRCKGRPARPCQVRTEDSLRSTANSCALSVLDLRRGNDEGGSAATGVSEQRPLFGARSAPGCCWY
jgi:hypothetical protein